MTIAIIQKDGKNNNEGERYLVSPKILGVFSHTGGRKKEGKLAYFTVFLPFSLYTRRITRKHLLK
jgi:hypothetical protein|tara:strand:- start:580 stop:774 length:195 start_codon:yes stop_codon:yes gene_type:complete